MLRAEDGTIEGLRRLLAEQVLAALEKNSGARLVCQPQPAERGRQPQAHEIEQHQFTELCFCLRGRAEMWIGAELAVCEEQQLVIIPSGQVHSAAGLHCVLSTPTEVFSRLLWLSVFPFGAVISACESAYGVHRNTPRQLFLSHHSQSCLDQMLAEWQQPRAGSDLMLKYAFLQMIVSLWRGVAAPSNNLLENYAEAPAPPTGAAWRLSDKVIQQLRRRYYQSDLSLETLARAVGVNQSHLSRQFKRETGLTVIEYLNGVRIDAAKRLLLAGLKVSTVAEYVGLPDAYYFSRVFTRLAGCAPSLYQRQSGGQSGGAAQ